MEWVEIASVLRGDYIAFPDRGKPIILKRDDETFKRIILGYELNIWGQGTVSHISLDHEGTDTLYSVRFRENPYYTIKCVPGMMILMLSMS